jgi:hypothetical protein
MKINIDKMRGKKVVHQIDDVYDFVSKKLKDQNFQVIDDFIENFLQEDFSLTVFISLLTITLGYNEQLSGRAAVYAKAKKLAMLKYKTEEKATNCLIGLE